MWLTYCSIIKYYLCHKNKISRRKKKDLQKTNLAYKFKSQQPFYYIKTEGELSSPKAWYLVNVPTKKMRVHSLKGAILVYL